MNKTLAGVFVGVALMASAAARADAVTGTFDIVNGSPSASGGTVVFTLNGNGTIAASLGSFGPAINGFGLDSVAFDLAESNFSPFCAPPATTPRSGPSATPASSPP